MARPVPASLPQLSGVKSTSVHTSHVCQDEILLLETTKKEK